MLQKECSSKVTAPKSEQFEVYVRAVNEQYALIGEKRVALTIDGLKIPICKPRYTNQQSVFHNGWMSGHYIMNVFVFAPDGRIVAMVVNRTGAMHDSTLMDMGRLCDKMEEWATNHRIRMVVNLAFQCVNRP